MNRIFLFFIMFFCISYFSYADKKVILTSGKTYQGQIISETDNDLDLKTHDGVMVKIMKDKIEAITEAQARIVVKSGKVYIGQIIEDTENFLKITTTDGITIDIPKTQIVENGYESDEPVKPSKEKAYYASRNLNYKPLVSGYENYYHNDEFIRRYIGLTFLFPGGVNAAYAHTAKNVGFRIQAGYAGEIYGYMGTFLMNISKTENFDINLGLCAGYTARENEVPYNLDYYGGTYTKTELETYKYYGITVDCNYNGFFLELGLVSGDNPFKTALTEDLNLLIQIGYLFKL